MIDPVTAAALIAAGAIGYAITHDGKVVPITPAMLQDSEVPFAKKVEIDTATARENVEFNESGAQLFVKNPGTPTTTVYIRFNNRESELFELTALRKVKGPFGKFFITNEAGAGTLTLIVTKGFAFEFVESEVITAGTIEMNINDLADVAAPSPDDSNVLKWNASTENWESALLLAAELPDHKTKHQDGGSDEISIAGLSGEPADVVAKSLFNAQTILIAVSNNTPVALTVAEQRLIGRKTGGNITALAGVDALLAMGISASVVELNYVNGVTSAIQTQLGDKGDMFKSTYDPNEDGVIALAQLDTAVCSETEADGKITTHAEDSDAHHTKTPVDTATIKASNVLRNSNNAEKSTNSLSYVKIKEVKLNEALSGCRVKFALVRDLSPEISYARIYKNGEAIGTEIQRQEQTDVWGVYTQDFSGWEADDLIQIYAKTSNVGNNSRVKDMRFYYTKWITDIGGIDLVTDLESGDDPTISVTNQDP